MNDAFVNILKNDKNYFVFLILSEASVSEY